MQRIIFESAPEFIIVCILVGLAYASIQYMRGRQPWSKQVNWLLFAFRTILAFFLAFLLLGPIVKQIDNLFEKPVFIVVRDNSASVKAAVDSASLTQLNGSLEQIKELLDEKGFQSRMEDLAGEELGGPPDYRASSSDLNSALKRISNKYEGRNVAGVILVSDGLYNTGLSPLYSNYNFPVHTVGIGDTSQRLDISIRNIAYNKIAYQGNRFPLRAEVQLKNLPAQSVTVSLFKRGRLVDKQTKRSTGDDQLIAFDFQPQADEQGIQKYDIDVETNPAEYNKRNNRSSVFVEIVEGKKKILLVAPAPHPDIKAIREVVDKNANYEFLLHIPGVTDLQPASLRPDQIDLAIFHQAPDLRGKTSQLFQSFVNAKTSLFFILGQQSDIPLIARSDMPIRFENAPRDYDEVTPVANPAFSSFSLSAETNSILAGYPPVSVHYGKIQIPVSSTALLNQKVGSVSTDKPLLTIDASNRKIAMMLGEGIWRWRLNEFDKTEKTEAFDEVFGKLIQFLSTADDKRKFRSYPLQQEFSETEAVVFESQVYNDIFEPVYGNTVEIEITEENGQKNEYTYVTSPGNTRYQIGGLRQGVYRYRSRTEINGKTEEVRGEFAVVERQIELQNLTADFALLRKLSDNTGGRFFPAAETGALNDYLRQSRAQTIIHSEETYDSLINIKLIFWLLLVLVTAEWALRKYYGSY